MSEIEQLRFAEAMGYDAGRNKPNVDNCHFTLFATPAMTKAWEHGKKRGDAERESLQAPDRRNENV